MLHLGLLRELTPRQRHTHIRDVAASFFFGLSYGVLEMVYGLSLRLMDAGALGLYFLRAAQAGALLLTLSYAGLAVGRRKMPFIIGPRVIAAGVLLTIALVGSPAAFVPLMVVFYLAAASGLPVQNSIFKENYPEARRHALVGNSRSAAMLGAAISGLLAGWFIEGSGIARDEKLVRFRITLGAIAIAILVGLWLLSRIRLKSDGELRRRGRRNGRAAAETADRAPDPADALPLRARLTYGFRHLADHRHFRRFMIGYFLFGFAAQAHHPVLDLYMTRDLNVSISSMGLIYSTVPMLVAFFTIGFWGRFLDRTNPVVARILFNTLWMIPIAMLVVATTLPRDGAITVIKASRLFQGLAYSGSTLLWTLGTLYFARTREEAVTYSSVGMMLTGLRGLVAPGTGLLLVERAGWTPQMVFLAVLLVFAISSWMLERLRRDMARERERERASEREQEDSRARRRDEERGDAPPVEGEPELEKSPA